MKKETQDRVLAVLEAAKKRKNFTDDLPREFKTNMMVVTAMKNLSLAKQTGPHKLKWTASATPQALLPLVEQYIKDAQARSKEKKQARIQETSQRSLLLRMRRLSLILNQVLHSCMRFTEWSECWFNG